MANLESTWKDLVASSQEKKERLNEAYEVSGDEDLTLCCLLKLSMNAIVVFSLHRLNHHHWLPRL